VSCLGEPVNFNGFLVSSGGNPKWLGATTSTDAPDTHFLPAPNNFSAQYMRGLAPLIVSQNWNSVLLSLFYFGT
jgi:hypothetical protein